ncbi:MAG: ribosomal-processing cysteine protease Prp [Oscillospiraceae bacterium]|nr:ribosomal-processing cysteine protease Prp [Oscillospiraceae bacterium]
MIYAVFESENGSLCRCSVKGHAGFADAGQDIVCAAVSSAVQLTANLITESFQEQADISADDNLIRIILKQPDSGSASLLLEGLFTHLQYISEDYPKTITLKKSQIPEVENNA